MRRTLALLAAALATTAPFASRASGPIEVMVLGTYHFANPGLDLHNAEIDDVLSPRRQAEVAATVDALAAYRPTLVAVEADADTLPGRALPGYRDYAAGTAKPSRNEIQQIGFRLAKRAGLDRVVGIDAKGDFPFEALQAWAAAHGRAAELEEMVDRIGRQTRAFEALARTTTVGGLLRHLNDPARLREDHGWYMAALAFGAGGDQPGARLVGSWAARNLAICARLRQAARPGDRVVVVYGSGHGPLLRQCVIDTPGWTLADPLAWLPR